MNSCKAHCTLSGACTSSACAQHKLSTSQAFLSIAQQYSVFFGIKDLIMVKPGFKSVPPQFYFEIAGLASAVKWREIQNIEEEECF